MVVFKIRNPLAEIIFILAVFLFQFPLTAFSFTVNADALDPKDKDQLLTGVWADRPYVAEQNCYGLLLLFPSHKFAMSECAETRERCLKTETIGEWAFRGKVLTLAVTKRAKFSGGWKISDECDGCCYGTEPVVKIFSRPKAISLPCALPPGAPDLSVENNTTSWEMILNGKRYWKFNAGIGPYCELISLAREVCRK